MTPIHRNASVNVLDLMRLDGRMAVVTGGAGHLGLEISRCLLELGASVLVVGRDRRKAEALASEFGARVEFAEIDLNQPSAIEAIAERMPATLDILVNNALTWPKNPRFEEADWDCVTETLVSGVTSPICISRLAFERMKANGRGVIINNASMYGMVSPDFRIYRDSGMSNAIEYNAAKAAIIQITKYLAVKGAPHNIRVNAFSPGPFSPPGAFDGKEWFKDELVQMMPLGRTAEKWEIKGVIAFLAGDLSTYVTGQNIPVDGGWTSW